MINLNREYTEPEYRSLPYISYSMLAGLDRSPANINSEFESTSSMDYGSAVDTMVFDGEEVFNEKFAILDHSVPSDDIRKIIEEVYRLEKLKESTSFLITSTESFDSPMLDTTIYETAREFGYGGSNWKKQTILDRIRKDGVEYYKFLSDNEGKIILDSFMYEKCRNSVKTLKEHDFTYKYFNNQDGEEHYSQFPIVWEYKGVKCKSLLDRLIIDHNNKLIKPVDLKTTFDNVLFFSSSHIKWRYYIQASFYSEAAKYLKVLYPELKDYVLDLFRFIVISSNNPVKPIVYKTTEKEIEYGKKGGYLKTGEYKKGFEKLIEDYYWHIENEKYEYPREVYDNNGEIVLDIWK